MKIKLVRSLALALILTLISVITVYAAGTYGGGDIYVSGNTITGYCFVGYNGGTPQKLLESATLYVPGIAVPVSAKGTDIVNSAGPLYAYTYASVAAHHGEKMFVQCHHTVFMNNTTLYTWYTNSRVITIP